jgi:hypothetical protein
MINWLQENEEVVCQVLGTFVFGMWLGFIIGIFLIFR